MISIPAAERIRIAAAVGMHEQYLYQCLTGRRPVPIERCAAIERAAGGTIMRWNLRPTDWWLIWPELMHRSDAPAIPAVVSAAESGAEVQELQH